MACLAINSPSSSIPTFEKVPDSGTPVCAVHKVPNPTCGSEGADMARSHACLACRGPLSPVRWVELSAEHGRESSSGFRSSLFLVHCRCLCAGRFETWWFEAIGGGEELRDNEPTWWSQLPSGRLLLRNQDSGFCVRVDSHESGCLLPWIWVAES